MRIDNAIKFINKNLDEELNLATVSIIPFYSPFHFHRIFSAVTNYTYVANFFKRNRQFF